MVLNKCAGYAFVKTVYCVITVKLAHLLLNLIHNFWPYNLMLFSQCILNITVVFTIHLIISDVQLFNFMLENCKI